MHMIYRVTTSQMSRHAESTQQTDTAVLDSLARAQLAYPTVIAHRLDRRRENVQARLDELAERGLVEAVTAEPVYRVTAAGEHVATTGERRIDGQAGGRGDDWSVGGGESNRH
jgi:predicted ArsR family transcriptional regulator